MDILRQHGEYEAARTIYTCYASVAPYVVVKAMKTVSTLSWWAAPQYNYRSSPEPLMHQSVTASPATEFELHIIMDHVSVSPLNAEIFVID